MNFYGHATLAARHDDSPRFVLGAMLPDLLGMANVRLLDAEPRVAAGIAHHHHMDAVFHGSPTFLELQQQARRELTAAGLRRGPMLAVAHVAIELLFDGCLHERGEAIDAYHRALRLRPALRFAERADAEVFDSLCRRIDEDDLAASYRDPGKTAVRLTRLLARRPRLALSPAEEPRVRRWLFDVRPRVSAAAPDLLAEIVVTGA